MAFATSASGSGCTAFWGNLRADCWRIAAAGIAMLVLSLAVSAAEDPVSILADESIDPQVYRRIEQSLREPTEIVFSDNPLPDVLQYFTDLHRVPIELDRESLAAEGIAEDLSISLTMSGITMESALNLILKPSGLTFYNKGAGLMVTTEQRGRQMLTTRIYPIHHLVSGENDVTSVQALQRIIPLLTDRNWNPDEYKGVFIMPGTNPRQLVVRQNYRVHRQIEGIVTGLRRARQMQAQGATPGAPRTPAKRGNLLYFPEKLEQGLRSSTQCDFVKNPLEEACEFLEVQHQTEFWMNKAALRDQGIATDQQISLKVSGVSLQSALHLMLKPLKLTVINQDEVLKITTQVDADKQFFIRIYPVRDLINKGDGAVDYQGLIMMLVRTTNGRWSNDETDGGRIDKFENADSLLIRQTQETHREIEGILAAVRQLIRRPVIPSIAVNLSDPAVLNPLQPDEPIEKPAQPPRPVPSHPGEIEKALQSRTECAFQQVELAAILRDFEKRHQIPIFIDIDALSDAGQLPDQRVTFQRAGDTLDNTLRDMLKPLGLTLVNELEVLRVTTMSAADGRRTTRVYPIHDLVDRQQNREQITQFVEELRQKTPTGVWGKSPAVGGQIVHFDVSQALVIRQSQRIHRELEGILSAMRQAKNKPDLPSLPTRRDAPQILNPVR